MCFLSDSSLFTSSPKANKRGETNLAVSPSAPVPPCLCPITKLDYPSPLYELQAGFLFPLVGVGTLLMYVPPIFDLVPNGATLLNTPSRVNSYPFHAVPSASSPSKVKSRW